MVALCSSVYAERRQLQCFRQNRHRFLSLTRRLLIRIQRTSPKSPSVSFPPPPPFFTFFSLAAFFFFSSSLAVLHIGRECLEQRGELLVSHHNNDCVSCIHSNMNSPTPEETHSTPAHRCLKYFETCMIFDIWIPHDSRWEKGGGRTCWNLRTLPPNCTAPRSS